MTPARPRKDLLLTTMWKVSIGGVDLVYVPRATFARPRLWSIKYSGGIIDRNECSRRLTRTEGVDPDRAFFLPLAPNRIIVADKIYGNMSRFRNYSCVPNCQTEKWITNTWLVSLRARFFLPATSWRSTMYNLDAMKTNSTTLCYCQTWNCSALIEKLGKNIF